MPNSESSSEYHSKRQKRQHQRSIQVLKMSHIEGTDGLLQQQNLLMPPVQDTYITYDYQIVVVTVFSLCSIANAITWILCSPISVQLTYYYQVSQLYVDQVSLVYLFAYVPFNFVAQWVLGRYALYPGICVGALCTLIGSFLKVFVNHSFVYMLLGNIVAGIGQPFIMNSPAKIASVWFKSKNRIAATSIMSVSNIVGIGLGFIIPSFFVSPELLSREEGRKQVGSLMFWTNIIVAVCCLSTLLLMRSKPPTPPSYAAESSKESFRRSFGVCMKEKSFLTLMCMFSQSVGVFNSMATIIQPIIQPFGYDNNDSSFCGGMLVGLGIFGAAFYGFLLDKYQNYKKLLLVNNALFVVAMGLFVLGLYTDKYVLYFSAALMGFNVFPIIPICFELACEITFPVGEAFSSGLLMTSSQMVGIVMVIGYTVILDAKTQEASLLVMGLFIGSALLSLLAMALTEQKLTRSSKEIQHQVEQRASM